MCAESKANWRWLDDEPGALVGELWWETIVVVWRIEYYCMVLEALLDYEVCLSWMRNREKRASRWVK